MADPYLLLGLDPAQPRASRVPAIMLSRIAGPLESLLARGVTRRLQGGLFELLLDEEEASQGGMAAISMQVAVRCPDCGARSTECARCAGCGRVEERFSAWLAIPPGVADGHVLVPSVDLPNMIERVEFRVKRLR